jgi:hypothetical protein
VNPVAKSRKPSHLTNRDLNTLLTSLGFKVSDESEPFHRIWQHPEAGTMLILHKKTDDERPLEVDLQSVRTRLDYNGHLEAADFDEFVKTGKLAVP